MAGFVAGLWPAYIAPGVANACCLRQAVGVQPMFSRKKRVKKVGEL